MLDLYVRRVYLVYCNIYPKWVLFFRGKVMSNKKSDRESDVPISEAVFTENDHCLSKLSEERPEDYRGLLNRLSRIEGQVRGVKKMVENEASCIDIMVQISAVNAALNSFNKVLISNHIRTCMLDDIKTGNEEVIDELLNALQKLMR